MSRSNLSPDEQILPQHEVNAYAFIDAMLIIRTSSLVDCSDRALQHRIFSKFKCSSFRKSEEHP